MKQLIISALMTAAMPALAQQTPVTQPQPQQAQSQQQQPAVPAGPDAVAGSPLSTSPMPAQGPRSDQGKLQGNDAASEAGGGLAPPPAPIPPAGAIVIAGASRAPSEAFPPPPALDHYPICKAHQFDKCMEPGPRVHRKRG